MNDNGEREKAGNYVAMSVESGSGERRQEIIWNEGKWLGNQAWTCITHISLVQQTYIIYHPAPQNCTLKLLRSDHI